ncbi:two-component regulator propeller domain-containing protein [Massilia aerilata]|uniref:histidine kinase n=1 Tax=Massilia aerilata TaxID=453817 RepID=A0ABW0RRN2_9BURK
MFRFLFAAAAAVLISFASMPAQAAAPRSLRFEHLSLEQGLSQETVKTILQDRAGFMWFGTQSGLNRYDGYRIRAYRSDPADPSSLPDNYVLASYEDAEGRLWFGTRGGLARFDDVRQKFVRYPFVSGSEPVARNRAVAAIVGDGAGGLWVGTGEGLVHLDTASGRFRMFRHNGNDAGSLRDDRVSALALDGRGGLWVGTGVGIDHLPAGAASFDHYDIDPRGGAKRNTVLSLSMAQNGTLWVGTAAGLDAWRTGEGQPQRRHVGAGEGVGETGILTLYHDAGNNLWVGTDLDGLKWLDPASQRFVAYTNVPLDRHSLSDNQVSAVRVDRTGTLWVGTLFSGVNRADLASGGFGSFTLLPGEPGDRTATLSRKIRTIAAGADGRLWLGTTGSGLIHLEPISGRADRIRHDPARKGSLPDDTITAVLPGRGRLWVGSATGLSWRDASSGLFTTVPLGTDSASNYVQDLLLDRAGNLWVATRGGLFLLDPDGRTLSAWRHDPLDARSLGENYGFALLEDRAGNIWLGTDNGLDRLDRASGTFTHFRHDDKDPASLRHNRVYYLYESGRGEIWVGTAAGLHRMERDAGGATMFRYFPVTNTHEPVPIGGILEDSHGELWVSTTVGLTRIDPSTGEFKGYSAKDGLLDGTYFVGAAAKGADGELHFGGANGMTSFMPDAVRDNPYPAQPVITDFLVQNRSRLPHGPGLSKQVELPYRDSVFTLEFAALHFADPQSNRFAYRLQGFDRDWTETDASKRFATYTNLDPGHYVFEVRAANKDGLWSDTPARLGIDIAPPFWMTWWFRLLAGLAVIGAGVAVYRLRIRVLVQQTERLERTVGARTAELVLQKEAAEQQKEAALQARRNIALLSDIGRELTANLDSEAIMKNVYGQVRQLMDVNVFAIGVLRGERLDCPFVIEDGKRVDGAEQCGARVMAMAMRCAGNGEEILIDDFERDAARWVGDLKDETGARPPASLILVPVLLGARALGVLCVQSRERHAYQHLQLDMLSTLAAYVGVALDNADAYRQLKDTQAQLAAHERLASVGSLVAGVAHELNTPIGNSLLMASTLQEKTEQLAARFASASLKKSELEGWIGAAGEASALIQRSLHAAAELVNSFKQVSVDQASTQRRRFDLAQACQEIAATIMNQVRRGGHTLSLEVPPGIVMDSYPGPLGQVVINFVNNALLHAFEGPGGVMVLSASLSGAERVRIEFRDNGRGIPSEYLSRIFDPFFTTRMGQGGTGLGLNIAYNIATTLLGGTIRVDSVIGQGTVFVLDLPLRAVQGVGASVSAV